MASGRIARANVGHASARRYRKGRIEDIRSRPFAGRGAHCRRDHNHDNDLIVHVGISPTYSRPDSRSTRLAIYADAPTLSVGAVITTTVPGNRGKKFELTQILGLSLALLLFRSGIRANVSGGSLSQNKGAWVTHVGR